MDFIVVSILIELNWIFNAFDLANKKEICLRFSNQGMSDFKSPLKD